MEIAELAARWNITPAALRMAISRGALKAVKVGSGPHGVWLIADAEVERYERENRGKFGAASARHPKEGLGRPQKRKGGES